MKNFSAKTANFQNLKVKDANVISEVNLGTAPNQIPLNKDLGSLAYQDAVNLDDVSADMVELRAIAAEISDSAVDVFVYDTSRDSDGGKWRERTQHTSWYNEELNTATRGARREFPAVAVIVAEVNKVTIYDGDDPDMGMWMVFEVTMNMNLITATTGSIVSSLYALNGVLCVGINGSSPHLTPIDFISEKSGHYTTSGNKYFLFDISKRNNTSSPAHGGYDSTVAIVNSSVNDVAMTILPNAPIDEDTGLPVPTIAVACGDGSSSGFSIINHDGTVANKSYIEGAKSQSVSFTSDNRLVVSQKRNSNGDIWVAIYDNLTTSTSTIGVIIHDPNISVKYNDINHLNLPNILSGTTGTIGGKYIMSENGLTLIDEGETYVDDDGAKIYGMAAYATSKYNTGWMPGDIKLAALSDSVVENVGLNSDNLLTGDNSTFTSSVGDWGGVHAILSVDANRLKVTSSTSTDTGLAYLDVDTVVGARYSLEVSIDIGTSPEVSLRVYNGAGFTDHNTFVNKDTSGTYYVQFNAGSSTSRIVFANNSVKNEDYSFFDNVSLKQTTELITNGDFSNGDDGSWNIGNESTATFANDQLTITGTRVGGPFVKQDLFATGGFSGLVEGRTYTIDVDVESITSGIFRAYVGPSTNSTESITTAGRYSHTFVHNSSYSAVLYLQGSANQTVVVNSISVRPAEEDRSVNSNGLQIVGEIQKTPVAPGADLVAYSGFSANNYLVQPYNADLDFGAGDFCVMGWFKSSDISSTSFLLDNSDQDTTTNLNLKARFTVYRESSMLKFYINNQTINSQVQSLALSSDIWYFFTAKRTNGNIVLYVNGEHVDTGSDKSINLTNTNSTLVIGTNWNRSTAAATDDVCLLRISATAPTPEQIAKIYRDEKVLFQEGAQSTLYGTSDAVTALAYDEKTELLHVGTASGRSDFSGLRRINNTTTAITTSISAHNNLIAEQ
jgi:hypothetical protein